MAERRMFAKTIVLSDAFLDMPLSARCLYFTLGMFADDDGFINNPRSIMRQAGASNDDMNILLARRFVLSFESGVIVIKHWRIHNYIRSDRYNPTKYADEASTLKLDENGAYTERAREIPAPDTVGIPVGIPEVHQRETQDRLGKDRLGKYSIDNVPAQPSPPPTRHKYGTYQTVLLSDADYEKLKSEFPTDYNEWIERVSEYVAMNGKKYKNFLAVIRNWARRDTPKEKPRYM